MNDPTEPTTAPQGPANAACGSEPARTAEEPTPGPREDLFLRCLSLERRRLFAFVFSLVPNTADAEDVFQQTCVTLWRRFGEFDERKEFYPWACGVAFYTVQNFRRQAKRGRLVFSDELVQLIAEERLAGADRGRRRLDLLQECLTRLSATDRDLIRSVYEDGSSAREAAERLDKAVQTIHNRLTRIRRQLWQCVERRSLQVEDG
ncbi:sigma-70 family RNA polymerase sigma factor [Botrimarina sp.]|uniref:sigma-70 family RNA polymerase sigma factor n=1 Tax=Botrimarina sp. TaxID=2795802 RepID=UPI0032ED5091